MNTGLKIGIRIGLLAALSLATASAFASPIFTFGFTDAYGSYTASTDVWDVVATPVTSGDVTRTVAPVGTASFVAPWTGGTASFHLVMHLTNITPTSATVAPGDGNVTITDANGDTITAGIDGTWTRQVGYFGNFAGLLSNVALTGLTFDGPSGGSFSTDFSNIGAQPPYDGSILELAVPGLNWFDSSTNFDNVNTLVQAAVLPEPASALLVLVGVGMLLRRR